VNRQLDNITSDARWRADLHFSTGAVKSFHSDWKPAHWDEHVENRELLIKRVEAHARSLKVDYNVDTEVVNIYQESRTVRKVTETELSEKLFSQHHVPQVERKQQ